MKNSTGLDRIVFADLIDLLRTSGAAQNVPPILGLITSAKATLKYLRRNRVQADIADDYGVVGALQLEIAELGEDSVEPIFAALLQTLEKQGLARVDPVGEAFDPNLHEAVMHEPAEDGDEGTVVSDVMRPGYSWKGLVVRPAMVKVRG